ncbi:MAG: glycosyltransferase family 39 protein [Chloroflexi bacterium]|nr:glycosyltransferase family 39 protein [Chloroflexota bacterium]
MRKSSLLFLLVPIVPTSIYVLSLLFYPERDLLILWHREFNVPLEAILPLILCLVIYGLACLWLARGVQADKPLTRPQRASLIGLAVVGGLAIQFAVTRVTEPDPLVGIAWRTYAIKSGGYWSVGAQVQDVAKFIGDYPKDATEYPVHEIRHPPGLSLIFWAGAQIFKLIPQVATTVASWLRPYSCLSDVSTMVPANQMASGALGIVIEILLAMLPVVPLYALVKRLAGTKAAVWAVLLYPLTPGYGMWVAQFDRGFALASASVLYLCEDIVTKNSYRNAFLAGLVLSFATFASVGTVPIAMLGAVYALVRIYQTQPAAELRKFSAWRPRIIQALLVLLGVSVVWAIAYFAFGLNPVDLFRVIFDSHLSIDFPYWPFVVWHPWDIITFIGLPIVALVVVLGWKKATPLTAAFVLTLFTLSVIHIARGETGRVWLFFTPVAVGAAAILISARRSSEQTVIVGFLAMQLVVMAGVLRVMNDYGYTPQAMPPVTVPADTHLIDTRFGASGQIALLGYTLPEVKPGDYATMTLYWQDKSAQPIETAYKVFIHVADDENDQARLTAHDASPVDWLYPTTCWQPNQIVADVHPLVIPTDANPGRYPVFVGLYDPISQTRPPTFASPPARQMYGSILLPEQLAVTLKP